MKTIFTTNYNFKTTDHKRGGFIVTTAISSSDGVTDIQVGGMACSSEEDAELSRNVAVATAVGFRAAGLEVGFSGNFTELKIYKERLEEVLGDPQKAILLNKTMVSYITDGVLVSSKSENS